MDAKIVEAFQNIQCNSTPNLNENIWQSVVAYDKKITRIKFYAFSFIELFSLFGLVEAFRILSADLSHSGFFEYFSLIFSSTGLAVAYWKELIFSIVESLPTTSILLTLSVLFIFFFALKHLIKQFSKSNHLYGRLRIGQLSF